MRWAWLVVSALLLTGCDQGPPPAPDAPEAPQAPPPATSPDATPTPASSGETLAELQTGEGTYTVRYRPTPDPIPLNDLLSFDVTVEQGGKPVADDITLFVDAAMPDHGHGMNTTPQVEPLGDGRFRAEGLMLHMAGRWEVYFDVTRAGVTERAQFELELE